MAMLPRVDFGVVSFNRGEETVAAIDSALAQEGVDGRVFVFDQNSAPPHRQKLIERCAGDTRIKLVLSPVNLGVTRARNALHAHTSAPYIIWLDDDARFPDGHQAARAVAVAEKDPGIAAVGFCFVNPGGEDTRVSLQMEQRARQGLYVAFIGAGFLLRRDAFEAAGGFDDRLFFYHDEGDLCLRLVNLGHRVAYAHDVKVIHPFGRGRTPGRAYYDMRNTVYLAAKYNFPISDKLGGIVNSARIRRAFPFALLRGAAAGLTLLPAALWQHWSDPRTRLSPETKRFVRGKSRS
jgi:GT2 family glycosyltransferase